MPKINHIRPITIAAISVTVATALSWGGWTVAPMGSRLMTACFGAAVGGMPTTAVLWAVRWVKDGGMRYLIDAMLSQREKSRTVLAKTLPLKVVH